MPPAQHDAYRSEIGDRAPAQDLTLNLRELGAAVRRRRVLVILCVLLCVGAGVAYTSYARPAYEATSVLRFEVERVDLPQLVQMPYYDNLISTEIEVLGGPSVAEAVIDSLGLRARLRVPRHGWKTALFSVLRVSAAADSGTLVLRALGDTAFAVSRANSTEIIGSARVGDTLTLGGVLLALAPVARGVPEIRVRIDLPEEAIRRFQSELKVSRPARDANLVTIRASAGDPVEAAARANLLARNIIASREAFRSGRTGATVAFLHEQADSLRRQLRDAEDSVRAYQEREHVVDVPEQARSEVARLATLQAELAVVRADRDAFSALVEQLRRDTTGRSLGGQAPSRRLMAFPTLLRNEAASVLLGALAQVETERSQLLIRRLPSDSDVVVLSTRIREIESQLQGIAESFLQSLTNQVASLQGEANRFGTQLDALPEKELQSARRQRDAKVLNDLWVLVQTRLKESQLTGAVGDPTIRLVDVATPTTRPVRPNLLMSLALSAVLGCMTGLAALLAREYSDRSVRSRADALSAAGLPVLGAIPRVSQGALAALPWRRGRALNGVRIRETGEERALAHKRNPRARSIVSMLVTHPNTSAAYVESFNQLFANLALVYWQRPLKVVVFTSPLPGEGKTLSAINFALTGAARGLRVLIVDADLRCGVVNTVLACGRAPGFAELLAGTSEAGDVLRQVHVGDQASLYVVPSGALPKVPGRVLTVERVHAVIGKLSPMFDFVVVDTPPVNLLADAALLGSAADAVMMVIRAGHTKADDLRYAMEQLEATKAPVIGTLLNDIDLRRNAGDDGAYRYLAQAERYRVSAD